MVWYERYAMKFIYPSICLSVFDPDSSLDNQIEIVFDAYGDLNGINYKGQFMPIPPYSLFFRGVKMRIASTCMRLNGEEREQESIFSTREGKEYIEKWVKWFKKELLGALEKGEDVEILIGLKPNNGEYVV